MNMIDDNNDRADAKWGSSEEPGAYMKKWPNGYFDQCDALMHQAREYQPTANLCVLEGGLFEVRYQERGSVYCGQRGGDRIAALTQFVLSEGAGAKLAEVKPDQPKPEIQLPSLRRASSLSANNWVQ